MRTRARLVAQSSGISQVPILLTREKRSSASLLDTIRRTAARTRHHIENKIGGETERQNRDLGWQILVIFHKYVLFYGKAGTMSF